MSNALADLGTDANGRVLFTEKERWFEQNGVVDEGARAAYGRLWRAIESETARWLRPKSRD